MVVHYFLFFLPKIETKYQTLIFSRWKPPYNDKTIRMKLYEAFNASGVARSHNIFILPHFTWPPT
jgi:hypothetical protein